MTLWPERRFAIERWSHLGLHLRRLPALGGGSGTLLYIHGLGESCLSFERLMADPRLAAWHQLAPDMRGYGKSSWAAEPLDLEQQADQLAELLRALDIGPVVLLGHSMGGVISVLLAERFPELVRALVNVEGNISLGDCGYSSRANPYSLEDWLAEGYPRVLDQIYANPGEKPEVRRAYGASIQMGDPRAFHRNSQNLVAVSGSESLARRMAALDLPKIYLHGAPRGTGERSRQLLAEAGVPCSAITDAGHWPFLDQHDRFVSLLGGFLATLPSSDASSTAVTTGQGRDDGR